jgi:hypothetical protein
MIVCQALSLGLVFKISPADLQPASHNLPRMLPCLRRGQLCNGPSTSPIPRPEHSGRWPRIVVYTMHLDQLRGSKERKQNHMSAFQKISDVRAYAPKAGDSLIASSFSKHLQTKHGSCQSTKPKGRIRIKMKSEPLGPQSGTVTIVNTHVLEV